MGVFGLHHTMKTYCRNGFEPVNIEEIAKKYREEMKKEPVMLVDISSCACFFVMMGVPEEEDVPVDVKTFQKNFTSFINKCSEIGIQLIFVGEGMRPLNNYEEWIEKTKLWHSSRYTNRRIYNIQFHRGMLLSMCPVLCWSTKKCKYLRAVYDADNYIMRFARTNGCFAILSNDSDFIFAEGSKYCLSIQDFDLSTMSTGNFNRNNLSTFLKLRVPLLPVFPSIFHSPNHVGYQKKLKAIQNHPTTLLQEYNDCAKRIEKCPVDDDLEEILDFFTTGMLREERRAFERKYRLYTGTSPCEDAFAPSGNKNWDEILAAAEARHCDGVSEKRLLEIISKQVCFLPPKSKSYFPVTPIQLVKDLRLKIYGILFFEHPDDHLTVTEYSFVKKQVRRNSPAIEEVIAELRFDRRSHPGLLQLWSSDRSNEMMDTRRRLFLQTLDEKLTPDILDATNLPEELIFPVLAVFYLLYHTEANMTEFAVPIILTQVALVHKLSGKEIPHFPVKIDFRANKISEHLLTTIDALHLLNSVCGEPYPLDKTSPHNYYDGSLFQLVYEEVTRGRLPRDHFLDVETPIECNNIKSIVDKIATECGHTVQNGVELAVTQR